MSRHWSLETQLIHGGGAAAFGDPAFAEPTDATVAALEERFAALEGGTAAVAVSSGQVARLLVVLALTEPGDAVVVLRRMRDDALARILDALGRSVAWRDPFDIDAARAAVGEQTRAVFAETIPAPGGVVTDLDALGVLAQQCGVPFVVDNTQATPFLCRPFEHGADVVIHALSGVASGADGGLVIDGGTFDWSATTGRYATLCDPDAARDGQSLHERFGNAALAAACRRCGVADLGAGLTSSAAASVLAGIETLALRMRRSCDGALAVAEQLNRHDKVAWVSHAGLPGDPGHAVMQRICPDGAGTAFTFGLASDAGAVDRFIENLRLVSAKPDSVPAQSRAFRADTMPDGANADAPDAVCLSIGLEATADILTDIEQALARV